ncbi:hypothetical protein DYH55_11040 [Methylovirgula sp. 4M-Z18]|nr:hypothetical protein DYH55_11040 [Methylovirgula sp. 4M-Z18]
MANPRGGASISQRRKCKLADQGDENAAMDAKFKEAKDENSARQTHEPTGRRVNERKQIYHSTLQVGASA